MALVTKQMNTLYQQDLNMVEKFYKIDDVNINGYYYTCFDFPDEDGVITIDNILIRYQDGNFYDAKLNIQWSQLDIDCIKNQMNTYNNGVPNCCYLKLINDNDNILLNH